MAVTFSQSVARRVRDLRERHRMTQQDLATALANFGTPIDRSAVARLEKGERILSLDETMHLARALHIAPVHLLVDPDGDEPIRITPQVEAEPWEARAWIRGQRPIAQDARFYFMNIPAAEFEQLRPAARDLIAATEQAATPPPEG
jgi:transcriptional regulator with XRE-family HTH domain